MKTTLLSLAGGSAFTTLLGFLNYAAGAIYPTNPPSWVYFVDFALLWPVGPFSNFFDWLLGERSVWFPNLYSIPAALVMDVVTYSVLSCGLILIIRKLLGRGGGEAA